MRSFATSAALLATVLALAACSTVEVKEPVAPTQPTQANTREVKPVQTEVDPLNDKNGALAKRSVYFDYDKYAVKEEYAPTVAAHGKYLASRKDRKVVIQGNTDERGGNEYNLALGQKRAEAVRKSLSVMGVAESQLEAVSFGKTKPKAEGHDEAAWAENRRADIVYQ